ncbi:hypothetical protein MLD38_020222 [Melastoma candidum]|uniref:Uncharacterized protein n=1 Tax=Melastoma candidum TaxID=119954 RepID=A0ACB9QFA2_9MYRT|nr:hypothetical protein MLD38_020222 [Melastoma candidum]
MKWPLVVKIAMPVLALMAAILVIRTGAQMKICGVPVEGLMKCLPAVQLSNPQAPTQECCNALEPVKANLTCFCQYMNNPAAKAMKIDMDRAMKIPQMCQMTGVPSHC